MNLRSDLAKVRGLGSAKEGTQTFWRQRLSAIALIPLSLWFVNALLAAMTMSHGAVVAWIATPHVTTLLIALIVALFYHLNLGMQEVFEDYVHAEGLKFVVKITLNLAVALCALASVVAILKISFGMN